MSRWPKLVAVAAAAVVGTGALVAVGRAVESEFDSTKVSEVAALAQQDPTLPAEAAVARTVDGIGFPDWSRWGWTPVGGRADHRDDTGRDVVTVLYRKGEDRIAYSIVSGTDDVNSDQGIRSITRTPPAGKVGLDVGSVDGSSSVVVPGDCGDALCQANSGNATTVKRKINERSVILTAWPVSEELADEAQDMALRTKTLEQTGGP